MWQKLDFIEADWADAFNRRITTQLAFRAQVENVTTDDGPALVRGANRFAIRPGSQRIGKARALRKEALRREVFIRRDLIVELTRRRLDCSAHAAALQVINDELDASGGHSYSPGAITGLRM